MSQEAAGSSSLLLDAGTAAEREVNDRTSGAVFEPTSEAGAGSETMSPKQGGVTCCGKSSSSATHRKLSRSREQSVRRTWKCHEEEEEDP